MYRQRDGPGSGGLEGPEYLAWLGEQPTATDLMAANAYRLMSVLNGQDEFWPEEEASADKLTQASKPERPTMRS
ncbi:hypothetical protein ABZ345_28000 [Lentzea sp. NPDC005914]|uniref:hypothetical protein n=1 Tax=Lentzea sp. NPDC005914 TaxID=3154572 RepID=UPI00340E3BD7